MKPQHFALILLPVVAVAVWYALADRGESELAGTGPLEADAGRSSTAARGRAGEPNPEPREGAATPPTTSASSGSAAPETGGVGRSGSPTTGDVAPDTSSPGYLEDRARNEQLSLRERLIAIERLKRLSQRDEFPGNEVTRLLLEVFDKSQGDAALRADVVGAMAGFDEPDLMEPLVKSLADNHPRVRKNAAQSLMGYRDHSEVRSALERALANENDAAVRENVRRVLEAPRR